MDKVRLLLLLVIAALSPSAFAADDPFVGAWKLDAARSHLVAETMRYTELGEGRMRFSNDATLDYEFALDGSPHPTVDGRTMTWTPAGPGRWNTALRIAGKVTERASRTLSADGRELVVIADGELPDGTRYRHTKHYARVGRGSGLAGTWRNEQMDTNGMPDGYVISKDAAGRVTWEIPTDKQVLRGRFDGTEMVLTGPTAPAKTVFVVNRISSHEIAYVMKTNGKPGQYGTVVISADGDRFTERSWLPGREHEASTGVLVRHRCPEPGAGSANDPAWLCPPR